MLNRRLLFAVRLIPMFRILGVDRGKSGSQISIQTTSYEHFPPHFIIKLDRKLASVSTYQYTEFRDRFDITLDQATPLAHCFPCHTPACTTESLIQVFKRRKTFPKFRHHVDLSCRIARVIVVFVIFLTVVRLSIKCTVEAV